MGRNRRIPFDQLPKLGDWDGPIYGQLGVLATDGDKVECHVCGGYFSLLASHVIQAHGLEPDAYRALFGLLAGTALAGPALRASRRARAETTLALYRERIGDLARSYTPEERAARMRGRRVALEGRLRNRLAERRERFAEAVRRTWEVRRVLYPNGGQRVPYVFQRAPDLARRAGQKGGAALRSLLCDPAYHARFRQHVAEAKGDRVQVTCAVCGAPFSITPSALKDGERHLCGQACIREFRRLWAAELLRRPRTFKVEGTCEVCGAAFRGRRGQRFCSRRCNDRAKRRRVPGVCRTCGAPFVGEKGQRFCSPACGARLPRPEVNARVSAAARQRGRPHAAELRALDAAAFEALPPLARRLVRRYYGLDDGRPWSLRELARAEHADQVRLARLIAEGVAEVLGHR